MKLIAYLVVLISFQAQADLSCVNILNNQTQTVVEYEESILKRLSFSAENIGLLSEESRQRFNTYYDVLESIDDEVVLGQIANSFRDHIFVKEPFRKNPLNLFKPSKEKFETEINEILSISVDDEKLIQIWNLLEAMRKNLDKGFLNRKQAIILSYFLSSKFSDIKFLGAEIGSNPIRGLSDFQEKLDRLYEHLLTNLEAKKAFNYLINNSSLADDLETAQATALLSSVTDMKPVIASLKKGNFKIGNNLKSLKISLLLATHFTLELTKTHDAEDFDMVVLSDEFFKDKANFLGNLEDYLFTLTDNAAVVKTVLDIYEYSIFDTPLPVTPRWLENLLYRAFKNQILDLKNEASNAKSAQNDKKRIIRVRTKPSSKMISVVRSTEQRPQRRNPNKRKKTNKNARSNEISNQKDEVSNSYVDLTQIDIKSKTEYQFRFLRQPGAGTQTFIVDEEVIQDFQEHNEGIAPFLRAMQYGFTARDGQNGIKKMGANMNLEGFYEIKPGVSSYRVILERDGLTWRAVKFLHKDKVDAYLQKQ